MVARNAPPIEISSDFSARLAARIAEERRQRISEHAPSHAERRVLFSTGGLVWARRAAALAAVLGGSVVVRGAMARAGATTGVATGMDSVSFMGGESMSLLPASALSAMTGSSTGEIVVIRPMRQVGGALLPQSDDPLLDGDDRTDARATSVAATAPLWPTAQMAAHAANRFAAMEFGDVMPVSVMHTPR